MEVRQLQSSQNQPQVSLVLSAPINGRIIALLPFRHPSSSTDYIFFLTDTKKYAVISYAQPNSQSSQYVASHNLITHASGDLSDYGLAIRGNEPEHGPIATLEPNHKCVALHLNEGYITILPIHHSYRYKPFASNVISSSISTTKQSMLQKTNPIFQGLDFIGPAFHCRIEERDVFSIEFLQYNKNYQNYMPQLALLHQDSRGLQHVIAHSLDLTHKVLIGCHVPMTSPPSKSSGSDSASMNQKQGTSSTSMSNSNFATMQPLPMNLRLKKSRVEAGSGIIVPVEPSQSETSSELIGGILILGHRSITYHNSFDNNSKSISIPPCLFESYTQIVTAPLSAAQTKENSDLTLRFLLGDDCGRIHILAVIQTSQGKIVDLHLDTLGEANISSCLVYLEHGIFFLGSQYTDSQLIQILDQPMEISSSLNNENELNPLLHGSSVTYLNVIEEFVNLGPIVDFDLLPTSHSLIGSEAQDRSMSLQNQQSMAITASGAGKDGSLRLVSNGIGLTEYAAAELAGIKGMWNIRKYFNDTNDTFLVQSYVGETRILGVENDEEELETADSDDIGGITLAEIDVDGIDCSCSTLYAGNISSGPHSNSPFIIQITETEIRLINLESKCVISCWNSKQDTITVASANESGQIVLSLGGGIVMYLRVSFENDPKLEFLGRTKLQSEISCLNLNPFDRYISSSTVKDLGNEYNTMDLDEEIVQKYQTKTLSSKFVAIGLWGDNNVRILSLDDKDILNELHNISISPDNDTRKDSDLSQHLIARSLCFVTLDPTNSASVSNNTKVDMLFIGLGDGGLVSFVVNADDIGSSSYSFHSRKEVSLSTRTVNLVPFYNHTANKGTCVLATGDRPTVVYLAGGGGSNKTPKLCYSNLNLESEVENEKHGSHSRFERLIVNYATPFYSSVFSSSRAEEKSYSICISDDNTLRLGVIDDIEKLHVTSYKLGMAPRRVAYHESGKVVCVGCIDDGGKHHNKNHKQGNCIRFFDDVTFDEIDRIDLDPFEMILSMVSLRMKINKEHAENHNLGENAFVLKEAKSEEESDGSSYLPFLVVGTAYSYPDEDEPSRGRIILYQCDIRGSVGAPSTTTNTRKIKQVNEIQVSGGVYSICSFHDGTMLATINTKTRLCKLFNSSHNERSHFDLKIDSAGHKGHILSLLVKSKEDIDSVKQKAEQIAIVGDLARSISLIKYYPEYGTLEEIARDFNQNWVTAIEMLTSEIYLGAENFCNLFVLQRNTNAKSEEVRSRLDTIGLFNFGEMVNKFLSGSLVIPSNTSSHVISVTTHLSATNKDTFLSTVRKRSETLFGTIDGSIGCIIGLDAKTISFLSSLERSMARIINPVGNLEHDDFRAFRGQRHQQGSKGFVDGDLIESFVDLDRKVMEAVVKEMNKIILWKSKTSSLGDPVTPSEKEDIIFEEMLTKPRIDDEVNDKFLTVNDVIAMVEEVAMLH